MSKPSDAVTLLQQLIRNECVNLNTPESGHEYRSVKSLVDYLDHPNIEVETFAAAPGRESLVARLAGSDPSMPSLGLLGHLDVTPAAHGRWEHDPFGGHLVDGYVWGRGAVDMLYLTASMATAMKNLAESGFRPKGTLVFMAVADEESGGELGSKWLVENVPEKVLTDFVITEWGGIPIPTRSGHKLWITTGQKGGTDIRLRFFGTSAHASTPFGSDNALVKAAKAIQRISDYKITPVISDFWEAHVNEMDYDAHIAEALLDETRIDSVLSQLTPRLAARAHACTRVSVAPTVIHGGDKSNVIPDFIELSVLVRRLPGQGIADVEDLLRNALGDLWDEVEYSVRMETPPSMSPAYTRLWSVLEEVTTDLVPGSSCVQAITPGGNDGGYFRERGSIVYGFGITSPAISFDQFSNMMHGDNERIDVASVELATRLWENTARRLL